MKKNDYVQFTGKLPKELLKSKGPVYGTIVAVKGTKAEVKPRYRHFNVTVALADISLVDYEKFRKPKKTKKKTPTAVTTTTVPKPTKVVVLGAGPVRTIPKPIDKVIKQEADAPIDRCSSMSPTLRAVEMTRPTPTFSCSTTHPDPSSKLKGKPSPPPMPEPEGKGMIMWTIIFLALAAVAIAYFTLK